MKRILYIMAALCLMAPTALAKPLLPADAHRAATHFWQAALHAKGELQQANWNYDEAYLFTGSDGGFIILSADDCARPVIAYSTTGYLNPRQFPVQLAERMEAYCGLIADGARQQLQASPEDAAEWQTLLDGTTIKDGDAEDRVGPLLETHWHQDGAYSLLCPPGTVTGCAATAQSQFMRYWKHPAFGFGSESYSLPAYGTLSADFAHTLYDWEQMSDQVTYASSSAEQVAVSTLMYHVGVSLHMSYNPPSNGGSGAAGLVGHPGVHSIDNSLKDYFFYSQQMRCIFRTDAGWTDQAWADSLAAELRLLHPIVYCGVAPEGGHGFVCDGYEYRGSRVFFHFNFGWSGNGDGYYTVDDICPNVSPTGQVGSAYHFNQSNQALLGAVPDYAMRLGDSAAFFGRAGGEERVLFCCNPTVDLPWSFSVDADWLQVDTAGVGQAGWVALSAQANNDGSERRATVTFAQGGEAVHLLVVQTAYSEEDYCQLRVVMQSTTAGGGWEGGAHLSFENSSGYVYATTTLASGSEGVETVGVAPEELRVVFHPGGGSDRYINYYVYNPYGEPLVEVEYAYRNGGTHVISWPCAHVSIGDQAGCMRGEVDVYPNPTAGIVYIDAKEVQGIELLDMNGHEVLRSPLYGQIHHRPTLDLSALPAGVYMLRVTTPTGVNATKIVKN